MLIIRRYLVGLLILLLLAGCAGLALRDPLRVTVVSLTPLPSEGLEARFAVKLRVQNPNETAIDYDGISLDLALADSEFGSGVSAAHGSIPRYGEVLVTIPVTVSFTAIMRQLLDATDKTTPRDTFSYRLRGRLGGVGLGGIRFDSQGDLAFPGDEASPAP